MTFREELRALCDAHADDGEVALMEALVAETRRLNERVRQGGDMAQQAADFLRSQGSEGCTPEP